MSRSTPMGRVLHNKQFLALWIAQLLSQLSFHMINFSLITQIFAISSSSLAVSFLVLAIGLPALAFGIIAGPLIDSWGKKRVLIWSNILRAIAVLGFFYVGHQLLGIYLITFIISSITQFFAPAESATLPELVGKREFSAANTLFVFTLYAAFIVGYSVAGPLQHLGGEHLPLTIAVVCYAVSALLVATLSTSQRRSSLDSSKVPLSFASVRQQVAEGLNLIRTNLELWIPITQLAIAQGVTTAVFVLAPAFAERVLHISVRDASYILVAPAGLGIISGALLLPRVIRRLQPLRVISAAMVVLGGALLFMASINNGRALIDAKLDQYAMLEHGFLPVSHILNLLAVAGVGIFILGFAVAVITIASQTLIQQRTAPEVRTRIFGVLNVLINIAGTFPILLVGLAADLSTADTVIAGLGVLVLAWTAFEIAQRRRGAFSAKKSLT